MRSSVDGMFIWYLDGAEENWHRSSIAVGGGGDYYGDGLWYGDMFGGFEDGAFSPRISVSLAIADSNFYCREH